MTYRLIVFRNRPIRWYQLRENDPVISSLRYASVDDAMLAVSQWTNPKYRTLLIHEN